MHPCLPTLHLHANYQASIFPARQHPPPLPRPASAPPASCRGPDTKPHGSPPADGFIAPGSGLPIRPLGGPRLHRRSGRGHHLSVGKEKEGRRERGKEGERERRREGGKEGEREEKSTLKLCARTCGCFHNILSTSHIASSSSSHPPFPPTQKQRRDVRGARRSARLRLDRAEPQTPATATAAAVPVIPAGEEKWHQSTTDHGERINNKMMVKDNTALTMITMNERGKVSRMSSCMSGGFQPMFLLWKVFPLIHNLRALLSYNQYSACVPSHAISLHVYFFFLLHSFTRPLPSHTCPNLAHHPAHLYTLPSSPSPSYLRNITPSSNSSSSSSLPPTPENRLPGYHKGGAPKAGRNLGLASPTPLLPPALPPPRPPDA